MNKNAFTLIEILIAIAVLSLVGSMASYAILKGVENARIKQAKIELEMVGTAVQQLAWDTGRWPNGAIRTEPGSTEIWDLTGATVGLLADSSIYTGWKGPYSDGVEDDPWGNPYFFDPDYRIDGVNHIVVGSFGPNGLGRNAYDDDDIYVLLGN